MELIRLKDMNVKETRASTVKLDGGLERNTLPGGRRLGVGGFGGIERVNIRPVMLVMMKPHGLLRDTRLEGLVVVGKVRQIVRHLGQ